jgi:glutamine synthetase
VTVGPIEGGPVTAPDAVLEQRERLATAVAATGVENPTRVRIETPDLNGTLRGKYVAYEKVASGKPIAFPEAYLALSVADEMIDVPMTQIEVGYPDVLIVPDVSTVRPVPWEPGVLAVIGDGFATDGIVPHPAHPRSVLRRVTDALGAEGYSATVGVEYEFFVFRLDERTEQALARGDIDGLTPMSRLRQGYSLTRWPDHAEFAADLEASMRTYGVPIESMLTEIGAGMLEAAIAPAPALEAADRAARFKLGCREVARRHGLLVSFMAKPTIREQGSSGHIHQSLHDGDGNAFWGGAQNTLTEVGRGYVAGLMRAALECGAFLAPFPNSYRRHNPEFWAPTAVSWGWDNRETTTRAITVDANSTRFELRCVGADLQPYLAIAACVAGGAYGIREGLAPPPPVGLCTELGAVTMAEGTIGSVAADLNEAAARLRASRLAREGLGDELVELYAASREIEQRTYEQLRDAQVPPFEIQRYLETA